ncbi:MAG: hypothetical protein OEW08_01340 [Gammaproteobacteria bacterium]|nr:hypothetical protein [Gammaproteobacteria bacterium]
MWFLTTVLRQTLGVLLLCLPVVAVAATGSQTGATPDALTGIEGLYSQEFSVKIFYFLVFSIVLFTIIVFAFLFGGHNKKIKTGEKWLFALIFFGIVVAVIFGATQMLDGVLF